MSVTASQVIEAVLQQPFGFLFDFRPVATNDAGQIELEEYVHPFQLPVITFIHIHIPFGMCQDGDIAFRLDAEQDVVQPHRWVKIRGFHQQVFPFLPQRKQVILREPLFKQVVEHVFRSKVKSDFALIGGIQFHKPLFQILRTVRNVLHDVRCQPNLADTQLLIMGENLQGFLHRLHPVVHTRQDVRMPVGKPLEYTAIFQWDTFPKTPHDNVCFLYRISIFLII